MRAFGNVQKSDAAQAPPRHREKPGADFDFDVQLKVHFPLVEHFVDSVRALLERAQFAFCSGGAEAAAGKPKRRSN